MTPPSKRQKTELADSSEFVAMDVKETATMDSNAMNRFSRQNAALGAETTAKLIKMKILIVGLRGVGVETAKNLALQGAGAITLLDTSLPNIVDEGLNFFITAHDLTTNHSRADITAPKLRELNPLCSISVATILSEDLIKTHSALVITDSSVSIQDLLRWNSFCRNHGVAFFYCFVGGVFTSLFSDFGPKHIVLDPTGSRPVLKLITGINAIDSKTVLIHYETPEGQPPIAISEGFYEISDVTGISAINGKAYTVSHPESDPVKTVRVEYSLTPPESYVVGGQLQEKKVSKEHPSESLEYKLKNPGSPFADPPTSVLTDMINFGAETQQHIALYATLEFATKHGNLPAVNSDEDADKLVSIAKDLLTTKSIDVDFDLDVDFIKLFSKHAAVELQPISAFIGGVLGQEVVKLTGKFTPIPGFMHFGAREVLPSDPIGDWQPRQSRYDNLAAVFGWKFVEQLKDLKYFMVGCGALGCEFMKNFALNGICCGSGKLVVTDADRIELSNLSRQFLFREHNVGQPKSRAAAAMAKVMNPDFTVEAHEIFVGPKTEDVFNDEFWLGLSGVCNALDNMEARLYVDTQCVKYRKSLLESGTMGTSGNVDTICPFKTRTYADGGNAAEGGGVPMCTLRNFPHLTDHCIEWSRDQFELLFVKLAKTCSSYIENPAAFEEEKRSLGEMELGIAIFEVRAVQSMIRAAAAPSIGSCAQLAFDIFHFLFRDKILDLQAAFPADARMKDKNGNDRGPFWNEKKRYPTPVVFNGDDESHWNFMLSATCLFAVALGVLPAKKEGENDWLSSFRTRAWMVNVVSGLSEPKYIQAPVSTEGMEDVQSSNTAAKTEIIDNLLQELRDMASHVKLPTIEAADFEKDDDLNFHIAFVTAAANLRCDNYAIKRTDFHSCKVIAGKIIAAIATTTAAVCGLVILELFKLVQEKGTDAFMNRQIGLAVNNFTSFTQEPPVSFRTKTISTLPAPDEHLPNDAYDEKGELKDAYIVKTVKRAYPEGHSVWDRLTGCSGSTTLREFAEWLETSHKLKMVSWDFVLGTRTESVDGAKTLQSISTPVFPPKPVLDYALLPALELTLAQATTAIMRTTAAKPTQQYIALWKECKAAGVIKSSGAVSDVITYDTTLREILERMIALAGKSLEEKTLETMSISSLTGRKFWVVQGAETPICRDLETDEEVEYIAAIEIDLTK